MFQSLFFHESQASASTHSIYLHTIEHNHNPYTQATTDKKLCWISVDRSSLSSHIRGSPKSESSVPLSTIIYAMDHSTTCRRRQEASVGSWFGMEKKEDDGGGGEVNNDDNYDDTTLLLIGWDNNENVGMKQLQEETRTPWSMPKLWMKLTDWEIDWLKHDAAAGCINGCGLQFPCLLRIWMWFNDHPLKCGQGSDKHLEKLEQVPTLNSQKQDYIL